MSADERNARLIERIFELPPMPKTNLTILDEHVAALGLPRETKVVDPKCLIGIEVEVERVVTFDPHVPLVFWKVHEDGSLRNNGREFVSIPISASYANAALFLLFRGINAQHEFSKRTSIHIHMNARDLSVDKVLGILLTYHVVEPLLFKFVGGNRHNNIFCVPWTNSEIFAMVMNSIIQKDIAGVIPHLAAARYSALNLAALAKFGTLEFRHLPGMSDVRRIVNWINLLLSLRLYAMKHENYLAIADKITALNTNSQYLKFMEEVFGDSIALLDTRNLMEDMERNVSDIKTSLLSSSFHRDIMSKYFTETSELSKYCKDVLSAPKRAKTVKTTRVVLDDIVRDVPGMEGLRRPAQQAQAVGVAGGLAGGQNLADALRGIPRAEPFIIQQGNAAGPFVVGAGPGALNWNANDFRAVEVEAAPEIPDDFFDEEPDPEERQ